jgi:phage gpG-like protein
MADQLEAGANAMPGAVPKFLSAAAILCSSELKRGIDDSKSPDGTPFAPLKHPRRRKRDRKAKGAGTQQPLRDTGLLLASLTSGQGHVQRTTQDGLTLGTNLAYAHFHQDGTKFMVARPFVGFSEKLRRNLATLAGKIFGQETGLTR